MLPSQSTRYVPDMNIVGGILLAPLALTWIKRISSHTIQFLTPLTFLRPQRPSLAVKAFDGADSLLDKLSSTDSTSFAPPPVAAPPVIVEAPPAVLEAAPVPDVSAVPDVVADAVTSAPPPPVEVVLPAVGDLTASFGDLPIVPIAIGALAVIAAVAVMSGGGGEASSSTPAPAPAPVPAPAPAATSTADDISIPYDAAARLAYEKAGSPGDYSAFKAKYEADAIAMVKSKQKK